MNKKAITKLLVQEELDFINPDKLQPITIQPLEEEELNIRIGLGETFPSFCYENSAATMRRKGKGKIVYGLVEWSRVGHETRLIPHAWRLEEGGVYTDATYQANKNSPYYLGSSNYYSLIQMEEQQYDLIAQQVLGVHYKLASPKLEQLEHIEELKELFL